MNGVQKRTHHELQTSTDNGWWNWVVFVVIGSFLLFAHIGCHSDEDNELFAAKPTTMALQEYTVALQCHGSATDR